MLAGFADGEKAAAAAGQAITVRCLVTAMRHAARSREIAELAIRFRDLGVVGFDIAGAEAGALTHWIVRRFIAHYGVDMAEAVEPDPDAYPSFNAFFTRALRADAQLQGVVLIALTGWGAPGDLRQSQEAGFDQHLTKPVSLEALEQALAAAASRAGSPAGNPA